MKTFSTVFIVPLALLLASPPAFSQSTNRAQLKSALLTETMKSLQVEPEIIEVYERISGSLREDLGEEIKAENIKTMTVSVYAISGYDGNGEPVRGGIVGRKILDIVSSDHTRDIVVDENRIYVRTREKVTIKTVEGEILAENFLDFINWEPLGQAADLHLGRAQTWKQGYTIEGEPQMSSADDRYHLMYFGPEEGWILFMPGNEARKLSF